MFMYQDYVVYCMLVLNLMYTHEVQLLSDAFEFRRKTVNPCFYTCKVQHVSTSDMEL